MTTYASIADSEIDPESPGTTTLFSKLRNNPIAMFEKSSGAPVLADDYIVSAMMAPNSVGVGVVGNDAIPESSIKWDSAGGISQSVLFVDEKSTVLSNELVVELYIYIPANANLMEFSWWQKDSVGNISQTRLSVPSADSSKFELSTGLYTYTGTNTLNVSAESGWTKVSVELFTSSNTVYVKQGTYRFI